LVRYWQQNPTDMVISVIPHFNRALAESIRIALNHVPFVTVLTDLADYPPHFWMERESEYLVCGTERAQQQAFELGHDRDHVFLASGMVLNPRFYYQQRVDQREERRKLGLDPDLPTGIVLFGGHGSSVMLDIVRRLDAYRNKLQLILICGKNQKLLASVKRLCPSIPVHAEGFTREIDYYMALSDFFIGKPGPGSISEALQLHLPVIVECNARTLPQERYNAQWITENRFGIVLQSFRKIVSGVEQLLDPAVFAELRANVSHYANRALFEIPDYLEEILQRPRSRDGGIGLPLASMSALQRAAWASLISRTELDMAK
jgi:1,2-diacylglycerol 3-beta-galactosyltransferase